MKSLWKPTAIVSLVTAMLSAGYADAAAVPEPSLPEHASPRVRESGQISTQNNYTPYAFPAVIRIATSRPACLALRKIYESARPDLPKLKCKKSGPVWHLVRA